MYTAKKNKSYILRVCDRDLKSYGDFQWKSKGFVSCNDFIANTYCGNGLHGWLDGIGDSTVADFDKDSKWLVLEVSTKDIVNLEGKVKFPKCKVIFCGSITKAVKFLYKITNKQGIIHQKLKGHNVVVGYFGKATAGFDGTATAGYSGTATAGVGGTATAGDIGKATAGDNGKATAGRFGTATAGRGGTATAGYKGTATAGKCGKCYLTGNAGYWIPKLNTTCSIGNKVFHSKDYDLGVRVELRR